MTYNQAKTLKEGTPVFVQDGFGRMQAGFFKSLHARKTAVIVEIRKPDGTSVLVSRNPSAVTLRTVTP